MSFSKKLASGELTAATHRQTLSTESMRMNKDICDFLNAVFDGESVYYKLAIELSDQIEWSRGRPIPESVVDAERDLHWRMRGPWGLRPQVGELNEFYTRFYYGKWLVHNHYVRKGPFLVGSCKEAYVMAHYLNALEGYK
jgi:hypothetical protein